MKIEPTDQCRIKSEKYQTRDGRSVRIYATDGGEVYPVHGAIFDGKWIAQEWTEKGHFFAHCCKNLDLVEIPQTVKRWVNVYCDGGHGDREFADAWAAPARIGVLRIEITGDDYEVFKEDV